jgi:hypothetical protein
MALVIVLAAMRAVSDPPLMVSGPVPKAKLLLNWISPAFRMVPPLRKR